MSERLYCAGPCQKTGELCQGHRASEPTLYTREQVADAWNVRPQQVDAWCRDKRLLPALHYIETPGGARRFTPLAMPRGFAESEVIL